MDGLEYSEILFSQIDLGDRFDSDYYTKNYLHISDQMSKVSTEKLGKLATAVASAFYPAATQLYSEGDTAFARCVDCVSYPVITKDQDSKFEKIPYTFGKKNKGISFIKTEDIIITKVGTPCYASILTDYDEIALSRTVMGLTGIHGIDPYYLMVFLRCKYGFEQLLRQRELTIQYQLTLPRVKAVDVFLADDKLQKAVNRLCGKSREFQKNSNEAYQFAEQTLMEIVKFPDFSAFGTHSIKSINESFTLSGRLDAEYYQPKYDALFETLSRFKCAKLGGANGLVNITKSIEPGSEAYVEEGIPFVRVSDVSRFELSEPEIKLRSDILPNPEVLFPQKDTILLSKDGSVGIAYKVETPMSVITSGALLHLKIRDKSTILPDYLTLVLNSPIVQLQAERDSNGAIIQHWKPSEIENVIIPILEMDLQKEIAAKVQESFTLRKQSKQLLEYAKQAVEIAIEQGEGVALKWLKDKLPVEV
jgi:type I restriction enzyme S subunit